MGQQQDTEIVLGSGKLLGIFLALAALCGAFFGMGYKLGRNSVPLDVQAGQLPVATQPLPAANGAAKPGAGVTVVKAASPDCATSATGCTPEQLAAAAQQQPAQAAAADGASQPSDAGAAAVEDDGFTTKSAAADAAQAKTVAPELAAPGTGIMVQVAAVSKQEDADALVNALKKKNYPVLMVPGNAGDKLFHVQVGPFAKLQDAESTRAKLSGDGYNAIVKK